MIRTEKASGKSRDRRDKLARIMDFLHAGDELVVVKLDRLGRSARDVLTLSMTWKPKVPPSRSSNPRSRPRMRRGRSS